MEIKHIIISGDLTENGLLSEYLQLQHILAKLKNCKIFVLAGNHDNTFNLKKVFTQEQLNNFELGKYNIQLVNSKIINKTEGFIDIKNIKQLTNSILFIHHPVINMQSDWDDNLSIINKKEFLEFVKPKKDIKMIAWGHSHEAKDFAINHIKMYSCPSTAYQFNSEKQIGFNIYTLENLIQKETIFI